MKKKTINKFGEHYLLGINQDGEHVYLEKESWDCGWYWGFGYLHTFTNDRQPTRSVDISSHTHFDSTFLNGPDSAYDSFRKYFKETVLSGNEIWELVDLMTTAYTLKKTAMILNHGYSYYTERAKISDLKDKELEDKINHEFLPEVFDRIRALLTDGGKK